ncbi:uncharacterized protein LOC132304729 [Cornus florida]|uniref:uncharacterized protein LOC132304729 n=1 Tax=Cornus florida TaxID=4283 RepID=UPI00289874F6|nr:uncharacterized protein LOC132304729 [Cornus florida]
MEVFTSITKKHITDNSQFKYHSRCRGLGISHLIFADDLLLFSYGDLASIDTLKRSLDHFSALSGLCINPSKSNFFVSRVSLDMANDIGTLLGFDRGEFPFKYLGVPLISTSLKAIHWNELKYTGARVTWANVCRPKVYGGLGFRNLEVANTAACLKHLWNVIAMHRDNIWARWIRAQLVRDRCLWTLNIPQACSGN